MTTEGTDDEPRAMTPAEMRDALISHLDFMARYWATTKIDRDAFMLCMHETGGDAAQAEVLYRLQGLLHSTLCALDGSAGGLPAFDLMPSPHADDERYHREEGSNWWTKEVINDDVMLHDVWAARHMRTR